MLLQNRDSVRDDTVKYNFYDKITVYGYGELSKLLIRAFELYRCYTTPNQQVAPKHQYCERNWTFLDVAVRFDPTEMISLCSSLLPHHTALKSHSNFVTLLCLYAYCVLELL